MKTTRLSVAFVIVAAMLIVERTIARSNAEIGKPTPGGPVRPLHARYGRLSGLLLIALGVWIILR